MLSQIPKNRDFRHIFGSPGRKKIFREKRVLSYFRYGLYASLGRKSQKTNDKILSKVQKTLISGIFPAFPPGIKFFPKIGLRHFLGIAILYHCAKNQKKRMSQSREKLVTDERTDTGQFNPSCV